MEYNAVLDELIVGSCPEQPQDIEALRRAGVTAVLSLQTDEDFARLGISFARLQAAARRCGIELRRVAVRDGDAAHLAAHLDEGVRALDELIAAGRKVYLHCTAGVGRAPSVAVAWLVRCRGWRLQQAADHVRRCRQCTPNLEVVRGVLSPLS